MSVYPFVTYVKTLFGIRRLCAAVVRVGRTPYGDGEKSKYVVPEWRGLFSLLGPSGWGQMSYICWGHKVRLLTSLNFTLPI